VMSKCSWIESNGWSADLIRMMQAQEELYDFMKVKPDAVIALEIGG